MITYTETTVFNVNVQTIVNTVNSVGVMGAGIALEFRLRYPEMYANYVERCQQHVVTIGHPYLYRDYGHPWILNFPTKEHWKRPSQIKWITQGLEYFVNHYRRGGITSIAFSQLGCGKGNLDWNDVKPIMEDYLRALDIPVFICLDSESEPRGVERSMVYLLNQMQYQDFMSDLNIQSTIAVKIRSALPLTRFRDLAQVAGVGNRTYEHIFRNLYAKVTALPVTSNDRAQPKYEETHQRRLFE